MSEKVDLSGEALIVSVWLWSIDGSGPGVVAMPTLMISQRSTAKDITVT
jgi:hypothetical protein